jgi:bloom syndrome protein
MFERSLHEGGITLEECTRQQDDVRGVANYCELDIECRREQVLRYFGQSFDRAECNEGCDNCVSGRSGTLQDFTKEAIQMVKLVEEAKSKLTQIQITAIYMGSKQKNIRDRGSSYHGKGQHLSPRIAERIIPMMLIKGYLTENIVQNNHNQWHYTYIQVSCADPKTVVQIVLRFIITTQVGSASSNLLDGKEKFNMMVSDSQTIGKGKKDKGKQRVATVKSVNTTKRMEISIFEGDDDDLGRPIEEYSRAQVVDSDEECAPPPPPKAKPPRRLVATAHESEVISIDDDEDGGNDQEAPTTNSPFHKKLLVLRRQVAASERFIMLIAYLMILDCEREEDYGVGHLD